MNDHDPVARFWAAPDEALFAMPTIAVVLGCSVAKLERDRWQGRGIKFRKIDGLVRARKADVVARIQECEVA
ncbi:MAG: DNA-binding protein [Acidobacteria bacterium]|nr:DNA-binding protein [Acidobacteriota bacterium]